MEEFREAMTKIMGVVEEEDVDILFMKVDTNCDGTVDWVGVCFNGISCYISLQTLLLSLSLFLALRMRECV